MAVICWLPSNQMRGITSPTSCLHRRCRQSQQIESLTFTDLARRNEHYRQRLWLIATSYGLVLSHRQHCHLPPPPSDDNQDDNDKNEDKDNKDEDDSNEDEDGSDDDNNNEDNNKDEANNDNEDKDNSNEDKGSEDDGKDNSDNDNAKEDSDNDSDDDDDNEEEDLLIVDNGRSRLDEDLRCLHTQLSIVRRLIVVLGPGFQVSYLPSSRPDFRVITTLQDCIGLPVLFCGFGLVDVPSDDILTFLHSDCLLKGFCLAL